MPAIWTFPASCSMVQSASSPLPGSTSVLTGHGYVQHFRQAA